MHPSWYQTGILAGVEEALAKQGIKPRPPVEVSDRIFEQVVKARSGRLVVPAEAEMWTRVRTYPLWVQDVLSGRIWRKKESFQIENAKDNESGLESWK